MMFKLTGDVWKEDGRGQYPDAMQIMTDAFAAFKTSLSNAEWEIMGHAASMPVEICMKLTPQCLDTAAYNKNKEREDFKKVSEVDTIQECEDAGVLALSLGTQIFHGNVPKSLRDVPQVIVGKIMLAKFSPGISLRFSRL